MVELTPEIMAQQSLAEEVEAINAYMGRAISVISYTLQSVLEHNLNEERNHYDNLRIWLLSNGSTAHNPSPINEVEGGHYTPQVKGAVSDVIIAQDSLREEIRAFESYNYREEREHGLSSGGLELRSIFHNNKMDEFEHAFNLFKWLTGNNKRWEHLYLNMPKPIFENDLTQQQWDIIKLELNSFMPSYQEEWMPWWGPKPTSGSSTKTTRTSRGGPVSRDKTTYIRGLQATNLSINMQPLQQWFSNTDRIITKWRKVKVKKQIWDPNAYDTTFNRKGAIIEVNEETMVPPPQFVKRWGRRIVIDKPEGTYRIDAGATAKRGYPGNYLVTLFISPRMTTAGQSYKLREEEYAMLYKKDMSVEECEYKTDELIRLIKSL